MLKCQAIGNLGGDPELRYSANGNAILTFNVASNGRTRSADGEWVDRTEWVRCRVIGIRAESLSTMLHKGARIYADGRLEARPWTTREGEIRAGLELLADVVEFMSPRDDQHRTARPERHSVPLGAGSAGQPVGAGAGRRDSRSGSADDPEVDLPF